MIEIKSNYKNRQTIMKIAGTPEDIFVETCMVVESIYTRVYQKNKDYAEVFLTSLINYLSDLNSGAVSKIKGSTQIAMDSDFEKFLENYQSKKDLEE